MTQQERSSHSDMIGKNDVGTLGAMIGNKQSFYLSKFEIIEGGGLGGFSFLGFVWPVWFLYRKMYVEFLATAGILILAGYFNPVLFQWISLFITIIFMFSSRKLYYFSILRKLDENKLSGVKHNRDEETLDLVEKMGGTSWLSVVIYLFITLCCTLAMSYVLLS